MRRKIAIGLVFYNDVKCLSRCLPSLVDWDYVICIDGRYDINTGEDLSTDGSRDVVQSFPNTILIDAPGRKQTDVRNMYVERAAKLGCDFVMMFECDEYITGDMEQFRANLPTHDRHRFPRDLIYNVAFVDEGGVIFNWPRLIYKPQYVRYGNVHYSYVVGGRERIADLNHNTLPRVEGILVHHEERNCRSDEHQERNNVYGHSLLPEQERVARERLFAEKKIL